MQPSILRKLIERGRALSKSNETKLRDAATKIQEVLQSVASGMPVNEAQRRTFADAAHTLLEAELSHDQQRQTLHKAIRTLLHPEGSRTYAYIREVYDTWLVYELFDYDTDMEQLYKVSYVIDDSGNVTFGVSQAVRATMVYEPIDAYARESAADLPPGGSVRLLEAAAVPLVEKAVRDDGTVPIKVIAPGWGTSGYYPAAVLERDGPTVFAKGTHMYWNHPTLTETIERPERSLSDLAAI